MKNSEMKNPAECWSAGVMGRWSNLATHHPITPTLHHSITPAQSSLIKPNRAIFPFFDMATDPKTLKFATGNCRDQSDPTDPTYQTIRNLPRRLVAPTCPPQPRRRREPCEGGSNAKAGQSPSKPVKAFPYRCLRARVPVTATIYCGLPGQIHNQWWLLSPSDPSAQPIRNPQSAIRNST
jgi:hypothetical protein